MGVCVHANNGKCDIEMNMSYSQFNRMRFFIGESLSPSYWLWKEITLNILCGRLTYTEKTENRLDELEEKIKSEINESMFTFLFQADTDGSLSYKDCKGVLDLVNTIKEDPPEEYGYVWCKNSLEDFKKLLQYCYSHRTKLVWY